MSKKKAPPRELTLLEYWTRYKDVIATLRGWEITVNDHGTPICKTKITYDQMIHRCAKHLPPKPIYELSFFDFQHALEKIRYSKKRPYTESTMKSYLSVLNDIYRFAEDRGDALNLFRMYKSPKSSSAFKVSARNLDWSQFSPATPKHILQAHVRAALDGNNGRTIRSLTLSQQAHLIRIIQDHLNEDGRYCGLAIILYAGLRPAEFRKITWGDLVPFLDHPDHYFIMLYGSRDSRGNVVDHMKTKNSYRKVPVHRELKKLLLERRQFVINSLTASGSTQDINSLPICCMENEFDRACKDYEVSILASKVLNALCVSKEDLLRYHLEQLDHTLRESSSTSAKQNADHLSTYVLRRNFWTWLQGSTQLSVLEKEYVMGHDMTVDDEDFRPYFNNEDLLWEIAKKMDRNIISLRLHKEFLYVPVFSNTPTTAENCGIAFVKLSPKQLQTGGTFTIKMASLEPNSPLGLQLLSPVRHYKNLTLNVKKIDHPPVSSIPANSINCEHDNFSALNNLRRK